MKKIILLVLLFPLVSSAQYYGERSTEQSFEQSDMYFTSYFLNTFGLKNFKKVSVGLIDNPFLNIYLNPAATIDLGENDYLFYLDFRGDRTEAPVVDYVYPLYFDMRSSLVPYPDIRWISTTRTEPEPIFSIGLITNPLKEITSKFYVGGTYQLLYREEKFYNNPYWIYNPRFGYDVFGGVRQGLGEVPTEDRYSGSDQMINTGHLFTGFTGYQFSDKLNAGLFFNAVIHSREGEYLNSMKDEFGSTNFQEWESQNSQSRNQNYDHWDLALGINYKLSEKWSAGIKAGYLKGKAEQNNSLYTYYYSKQDTPDVSKQWYYNYSKSNTNQNWDHDGNTKYFGFNFSNKIDENKEFSGYYKYSNASIDFTNSSQIIDTSKYNSKWVNTYDTSWYRYQGISSASDKRFGSGTRIKGSHEGMLNFKWKLSERYTLLTGIYIYDSKLEIDGREPVKAYRMSSYSHNNSSGTYAYSKYQDLLEDKELVWKYVSEEWSLQIPILLHFQINETFGVMLGVNRYFYGWKITDQTTAYFKLRKKTENGRVKEDKNFAERYTQPATRTTENFTDMIASFDINISPQLTAKLMIDPDFDESFRIAQWWLSFQAKL